MNTKTPKYPVYIISKGRWESRLTAKSLDAMNVDYKIVIEPQEYAQYSAVIDSKKILVLPFSNLGKGSIPARNFVWRHSIDSGAARHWILDDNIRHFYRRVKNTRIRCKSSAIFRALEDFVDRYTNVHMAGMQYASLASSLNKHPAFCLNARVYSCILLSNAIPFRWRGRYNEDTDLSLRILKSGACTMLFNAFLCGKQATMVMKGGNTDELYAQDTKFDGRLEMARSLQRQHPDCTRIVHKFGRWQHSVNYSAFKNNKLIRKKTVALTHCNNEYDMKLNIGSNNPRVKALATNG